LPLAELERAPDFPGVEVARQDAFGLVGRLKGRGGGPTLMLNGHVDRDVYGQRAVRGARCAVRSMALLQRDYMGNLCEPR
jgi:hypothetical protein